MINGVSVFCFLMVLVLLVFCIFVFWLLFVFGSMVRMDLVCLILG